MYLFSNFILGGWRKLTNVRYFVLKCYTRTAPATIFVLASLCSPDWGLRSISFIVGVRQKAKLLTASLIPQEGEGKCRKIFTGDFVEDDREQWRSAVASSCYRAREKQECPEVSCGSFLLYKARRAKWLGKLISVKDRVKRGHITQKRAKGKDFTQRRSGKAKVLIN